MKKNTSKTTKSPAPAKKIAPAVQSAKPAAKKKTTLILKKVASRPVATTITAKIDIGFGNLLYLRGEGPGLSWDRGIVMDCVADSEWQAVIAESARPISFKFLVNDLSWSAGVDYTAKPGSIVVLEPTF